MYVHIIDNQSDDNNNACRRQVIVVWKLILATFWGLCGAKHPGQCGPCYYCQPIIIVLKVDKQQPFQTEKWSCEYL